MEKLFDNEFKFITSRSSGAGGQHVNKVNTKAELRFDIVNSKLLSNEEKALLFKNLSTKINKEGILQIVSQSYRSQIRNKKKCIEKFYELIAEALKVTVERKKKKPPRSYHLKRLENKKKKSEKKKNRRKNFYQNKSI